jgi:putative SOS response-associated peptidase YedK
MPAILEGDALALWLNPKIKPKDLTTLLEPARDDLLEARAVSPAVNDVKNDTPELLNEWCDPGPDREPKLHQPRLLPD